MDRVVVITGGSSGIGLELVRKFAGNGDRVYSISRRKIDYPANVTGIETDITDKERVLDAFNLIRNQEDHVDVLICNAGMGISGAVESTEEKDMKYIFDVNYFGFIFSVQCALDLLRKSNDAHILVTSSVAAICPIPYQSFYSATKSAINTTVCALENELMQFNICVSAVMPGDVKTGFTDSRRKNKESVLYVDNSRKSVETMENDERNGADPADIASFIFNVAKKRKPKLIYTIGLKYKVFSFLMKVLPITFSNRIIGKIY